MPQPADLLCGTILDHMYTLGIVYYISQNLTFKSLVARRAADELLRVASLPSWDPKRFLTVAETMHGVSIGLIGFTMSLVMHSDRL